MAEPEQPVLRDSTIIGPYRVEVWVEDGSSTKVEVWKEGKLVRGPFRYTWMEDALSVASDMGALLRQKLGIPAP